MLRCVLIVLALLAAVAPDGAGAIEWPVTNGRDAVAWVEGAALHVSLDDGTRRTFPVPTPGCRLGGVNSTAVGFLCAASTDVPQRLELVDLRTGVVRQPATEAAIEANTGPTAGFAGYSLEALGDHVARIGWGDFHTDGTSFFSLDAGRGMLDLQPPVGSVVDLDAAGGVTPVCEPAPTRLTRPLLFRAPWILTQRGSRVQLRHCGSRVTRTIGRSPWMRPVLTGRFAAWRSDTKHVTIRLLATGRTYRVAAPHLMTMFATGHRLYLQATYSPLRYRVQAFRVR